MILRTLKVEGWRCFTGTVQLPPLTETINVIHAPNGSGKSTLFEAMTRSFFDSHRISGEAIERIRPWGRQLAPSVQVEFAHESLEYRLIKQFLDDKRAELSRKEDGKWARLAEGDAATDQVREMLQGSTPGRGPSDSRHWGVGQILWAAQGELPFIRPSDSVTNAIRQSLGVQVAGSEMGQIERRIEDVFSEAFTPTGAYRKGQSAPEVVRLAEQRVRLLEERAELESQVQEFEEASRHVEDLSARRDQASEDEKELLANLRKATEQAKAYDRVIARVEALETIAKAKESEYTDLRQRIDNIDTTRTEHNAAAQKGRELAGQIETLNAEAQAASRQLLEAKEVVAACQQQQRNVEQEKEVALRAKEFIEACEAVKTKGKLIDDIQELQRERAGIAEELTKSVAPDKRTLNRIRKVLQDRENAQTKLDAALIHLEITPKASGELTVTAGEPSATRSLEPEKADTVKGSPEVIVEISGVAKLRAYGPTESVEDLRDALAKAKAKIKDLCNPFGTSEVTELESRREQADDLQANIRDLDARAETMLDERTLEEIQQDRAKAENICGTILTEHKEWSEDRPDPADLARAAQETNRECRRAMRSADTSRDLAQEAVAQATERVSTQDSLIAANNETQRMLSQQLQGLLDDSLDDVARNDHLTKLALNWAADKAKLAKASEELNEFSQDPNEEVEALQRQLDGIREQAIKAVEDEQSALGRLQHLANAGTYSKLADVDNQIEILTDRTERQELRLNAVKLLHDLVADRHAEIASTVAKPVADKASRMLQRIAGTRIGPVVVGDGFEPVGVAPALAADGARLDDLSGGETEQVHLVVRLALADQLAEHERQMVVLDDVLTATDAGRLARIHGILGELSQRLQIMVLTCHPERYRGVPDANFIELEQCTQD